MKSRMKNQHSHKVHKKDGKPEKKATDHNITWVKLIVSFNCQCVSPFQSSFSEMFQKKTPTEKKSWKSSFWALRRLEIVAETVAWAKTVSNFKNIGFELLNLQF